MTEDDVAEPPVEVWPELWPAVQLFTRCSTQWRTDFGGRSGLDHNVVMRRLDRMGLDDDEWDSMMLDIEILEDEALQTMRDQKG